MHIAASCDGKAMKAYLDHVLVVEQGEKFNFKGINDGPIRIGCAKVRDKV